MIRRQIASIELRIDCDAACEIRDKTPAPFYLSSTENISGSDHQVRIRLCAGRFPAPEKRKILFQADRAWSIYKDTRFYDIVFHPSAFENSLWVARFDTNFKKGKVYCSEQLIRHNGRTVIINPVVYPLDQILMMHFLADRQGMILHAAGWMNNMAGWVFAGKSGAGKSTITGLVSKKGDSRILSDDRIIIRKTGDDFSIYGTPWPGDAGYALNRSAPLKGIFFLSKGNENRITKLNPAGAMAQLMPVASIPWYDREKVEQMTDFCDAMIGHIPMYQLIFLPDESAVGLLMRFIDG